MPSPTATWHRGTQVVALAMELTGHVTKGGQPLVEGEFTAHVDDAFCGWGHVSPDGTHRVFLIKESPLSNAGQGCRPGSTVHFLLNGVRAAETIELPDTPPEAPVTLDLHFP